MPEVDSELRTALKLTKRQPMFFGFIAQGADSKLLVQKLKIPPKVLAETKKECGGGKIFCGRCHDEDGTVVFEVAKEPPTVLATLLKKTIKQTVGLTLPVEVRMAADLEEELDSPEGQLAAAQTERATPVAPPTQAGGGALTSRLNSLKPKVKHSLAGPDRQSVQTLLQGVHNLLHKSDFAQAARVLDTLEKLLARSVNVPAPASPVPDGAATVKRLNLLTPHIKMALAGSEGATVQGLVRSVHGLIKSKDFAQAERVCHDLETLLAKTPEPAAPKKGPAPEILFRQARLDYDNARKAARAGVEKVQTAILDSADGDPQLTVLREGVAKLDQALAGLDDALLDTLDAALNAKAPEARQQLHKQAIQHISTYLRFVKTDELLNFVDTNEFLKGKVRAPLFQTLKTLKARLKGSASK